jgi:hypothetical protein
MHRILIDGLPRTGTTTLARLFGIHPKAKVVIEPFHPRRYEGRFHRCAILADNPRSGLDVVWKQWNVIKHVWEAEERWPFTRRPNLQTELWRSATFMIAVSRQNLLRRYVSAEISRGLRFWIGTRTEFIKRLNSVCLLPLNASRAKISIERDIVALEERKRLLDLFQIESKEFFFEEFFGASPDRKFEIMNDLYVTCRLGPLSKAYFFEHGSKWLNPGEFKWSSEEVYRAVPNIISFESELSSYGSLFDER